MSNRNSLFVFQPVNVNTCYSLWLPRQAWPESGRWAGQSWTGWWLLSHTGSAGRQPGPQPAALLGLPRNLQSSPGPRRPRSPREILSFWVLSMRLWSKCLSTGSIHSTARKVLSPCPREGIGVWRPHGSDGGWTGAESQQVGSWRRCSHGFPWAFLGRRPPPMASCEPTRAGVRLPSATSTLFLTVCVGVMAAVASFPRGSRTTESVTRIWATQRVCDLRGHGTISTAGNARSWSRQKTWQRPVTL